MVHQNYKWNISKEKGKRIALETINEILSEQKNNSIEMNELIFLLNNRTKTFTITNNKKKKTIINFLKINYGGIKLFLKENGNFNVLKEENIFIIHNKIDINVINLNDWIFVDESIE